MSLRDIADVLADRASHARLVLPDTLFTQLVVYYQVLSHWNKKINLTSLTDPDEAVDRLLLEPVAAAAELPHGEPLIDLGSGGGIAVPLSARRVGPTGKVYGLDMTEEMLLLARSNAAKAAATNVEFLRGRIEEIRNSTLCRISLPFNLTLQFFKQRFKLSQEPAQKADTVHLARTENLRKVFAELDWA